MACGVLKLYIDVIFIILKFLALVSKPLKNVVLVKFTRNVYFWLIFSYIMVEVYYLDKCCIGNLIILSIVIVVFSVGRMTVWPFTVLTMHDAPKVKKNLLK